MSYAIHAGEFYNKRAKLYETLFNRFRYATTLKRLIRSLPINVPIHAKILDIGCGSGLTTQFLIERFPKADIYGLDYSEEMLKMCSRKLPEVKLLVGDFNQVEIFHTFPDKKRVALNDASFDCIVSAGAISEYGDLDKALPFVYKLLKKDGFFINIGTKRNVAGIIGGKIWHFKPLGKKRFMSVCENMNFSRVHSIGIPANLFPTSILRYVLIAQK